MEFVLFVYSYRLPYELKGVYSLLGLILFYQRRKLQRFTNCKESVLNFGKNKQYLEFVSPFPECFHKIYFNPFKYDSFHVSQAVRN
jgi:hypothetical protein